MTLATHAEVAELSIERCSRSCSASSCGRLSRKLYCRHSRAGCLRFKAMGREGFQLLRRAVQQAIFIPFRLWKPRPKAADRLIQSLRCYD